MKLTIKTLQTIYAGLTKLSYDKPLRMNCKIPTDLALDWGCNHGGTIETVSNVGGMYGFTGISIHYDWGTRGAGSTSGHNMCFSLYSEGDFYSGDHWTSNTKENQKAIAEVYVPLMAKLYDLSVEELVAIGKKAIKEKVKKEKEEKTYRDYKAYLETFLRKATVGQSPLNYKEFKKTIRK